MDHKYKNWVLNDDIEKEVTGEGCSRKILAFCDELMCVENKFEKGAIAPMHCHPHSQITYIAEGVFEFTIGDEVKIVKKGDTMLKQGGVMHGAVCIEPGIVYDSFTPMREDFVK
ncbi:MAG: cupin domain-containing protein [Clostridia bacterium]